ncbi:GNAT family N-acetyltransferase [Luteolibacter ambystomatis]|uniref:GNAT family N-acetyltransferase n=1 Tax=Luteolibacter ambystomatis TaxID=2824561 RepID=A0A975G7B1_9BACT|nr:GNAT family N-acetyltransferase [Luteolibacter ambystomatis]QUE50283.1 GNAT family N-acetyltransferase [Luteolibacter ambystomatis]
MNSVLETERTFLRPFQASDATASFAWFSDPEVMRFIPNGRDETLEQTSARVARYMAHQEAHGFSKWIVIDRASGRPVGDAGFVMLPDGRRPELGYRFARPWWGRGLATEVSRRWIEVASPWFGFTRIHAFALPENQASRHVMEKVGFTFAAEEALYGVKVPLYSLDLA